MYKTLLPVIVISLNLAGCGGGSDSGSTSTPSSLEGRWVKSCSPGEFEDITNPGLYDVISLTFRGNTFYSDIKNYTDSGCNTPLASSPNPTASGTFSIGASVLTFSGPVANEIDTTITQQNGAPFIVNEYDIFYIEGNNLFFGDTSGPNDASSPALRPDDLDPFRYFVRQ